MMNARDIRPVMPTSKCNVCRVDVERLRLFMLLLFSRSTHENYIFIRRHPPTKHCLILSACFCTRWNRQSVVNENTHVVDLVRGHNKWPKIIIARSVAWVISYRWFNYVQFFGIGVGNAAMLRDSISRVLLFISIPVHPQVSSSCTHRKETC